MSEEIIQTPSNGREDRDKFLARDLEARCPTESNPQIIKNAIKVPTEKETFVYLAEAEIYLAGFDVKGWATLAKYRREIIQKSNLRIFLESLARKNSSESYSRDKLIWKCSSWPFGERSCYPYYFIKKGCFRNDYSCDTDLDEFYRHALNTQLRTKIQVIVSTDIFDKAFGPIDQQVRQIYEEAVRLQLRPEVQKKK